MTVRLEGEIAVITGYLALQPPSRLDPQVQFECPVDALDAFVVPAMPLDIAQMQNPQVFFTFTSPSGRQALSSLSALRWGLCR